MATPYIKNDGVNYKIQGGLPSGGVDTLQFTDSASSFTQTIPAATGTFALTTIATGVNSVVTTDMATAYRALDGLVMPNVKGYLTNTPPGSPADGDCYIIGAAPTGAWAGQASKVTRYSSVTAGWEFYAPKNGWMLQANSVRESYRFTGSAWEIYYQEGTWTVTWTGLTVVNGTGGATFSGEYIRVGNRVDFQSQISTTGTATTASAGGGTTFFNLPFTPVRSTAGGTTDSAVTNIGTALIYTTGNCYVQTWTARNVFIFTSGTIFTI